MTVSVETNKVTYDCDGSTTEFSFIFKVFEEADLKVVIADSNGDETVLTLTTDYTVSGNLSDGGKITTVATWATGNTVTITLDMDFDQPTDLIYGGNYSSEAIETMGDRLVKMLQQLVVVSNRTILLKISSALSGLELPDPESGKWLYSPDGAVLQWASTADPDTLAVTDFVKTLLDDTTASAFLTTLGFSAFIKTLLDDANAAAFLTTLGIDVDLLTFALPADTTISAFIKTVLDDADAATARTTLGCPSDPVAATAGLRTLGTGAQQALAGNFLSSDAVIKAWVNFNGAGTVAINDSFNVSSITDNGVGDYTINWDTDFADTNYCWWGSGEDLDATGDVTIGRPNGGTKTVGSLQIKTVDSSANSGDFPEVCIMAIGAQ